ncbi:bifunctional hydroxymethylpyrimidine kinase/phosphomethylpyrimidine kinase [Vibrio mangrovi]|uniref:hydroxymethylpyrimidine kinase n=1 Tax=Vibrio mangrovi TaxID=474394 RepID=A0A1Y6IMF8_9VIBR|nr:bifunctional hydroxymethylpyrimidine kinase/phosphomethylpyrimidine kinase [Vibrio mangrovi]MDW6004373.1 bifunctional hydroxymethylpyrimidine kinase/phosphomethylpyrimidine kinase [Vibrio mangrovi]SMR98828.1 Hydroxymethylpyrimidine/phosphomethylpyrimidine kinase [Vibrio mangrovi]
MTSSLQSSVPIVLTIAGSDSSGGAGIQADIKTISATGSYACSVITASTAQNTQGVLDVFPLPARHVSQQLDAVFADLNIVAVKIGMLANAEILEVVMKKLQAVRPRHVVIDPVLLSTSGKPLLSSEAFGPLQKELLPMADLITPNLPEAAALLGYPTAKLSESEPKWHVPEIIDDLRLLGLPAILLKGGHSDDPNHSQDWLITGSSTQLFTAPRIHAKNTHGTGCTLSSAIASYLARGYSLSSAIREAKSYISGAILHADKLLVGQGKGPLHHFYR